MMAVHTPALLVVVDTAAGLQTVWVVLRGREGVGVLGVVA